MFEKKPEEMAKNFAMHEMKYCTYEDYSIPKSPTKIAEESYLAGYKEAFKMKLNTTTISDAPLEMTLKDKIKNILNRLLGAVVSTRNTEETMFWITLKRDAELFIQELEV